MAEHRSILLTRLRRFLAADPGRFAGGSAVSDPLGLLAVEQERLRAGLAPGYPGRSGTAHQGTGQGVHGHEPLPPGATMEASRVG